MRPHSDKTCQIGCIKKKCNCFKQKFKWVFVNGYNLNMHIVELRVK